MDAVAVTALLIITAVVYMAPAIVALLRGHKNAGAIFALCLLLGWTFVGWAAAWVWVFVSQEQRTA